ncbi:MAG: hypothetical protein QM767_18580 [Anaeromyxobacter sp.]
MTPSFTRPWTASSHQWAVEKTASSPVPMAPQNISAMSISPLFGQLSIRSPSSQKAGHIRLPSGILMRATNRPWWKLNLPRVTRRAEVKGWPPQACRRAVMTSLPSTMAALSGEEV